jgi:hypothetical protein
MLKNYTPSLSPAFTKDSKAHILAIDLPKLTVVKEKPRKFKGSL